MSKFKIWVEDDYLNKVMSYDAFEQDNQREVGFTGGMPASSIRVNTALRQANLIACALMEIVDTGNTSDFRSSVATVQSLLSNYFNNLTVNKATNADITNKNTENNAIVNFQIGNGIEYNKTINNVENVTTNINGNAISDIFETNGTTVKQATNSSQINGIAITQDSNNILKAGDSVIPQKITLWKESTPAKGSGTTINFSEALNIGDIIEIYWGQDRWFYGKSVRYLFLKDSITIIDRYSTAGLQLGNYYDRNWDCNFTVTKNNLTINSGRQLWYAIPSNQGSTITLNDNSVWNDAEIYAVYKIIE